MTFVEDTFWDIRAFVFDFFLKTMLHFSKQSPKNSSPWSGNILRRCSFHLFPRPICLRTGGKWIFSFVKSRKYKNPTTEQKHKETIWGRYITVTRRRCSPLWRRLINNSVDGSALLRSNCGPSHSFPLSIFNEVVPMESPMILLPWCIWGFLQVGASPIEGCWCLNTVRYFNVTKQLPFSSNVSNQLFNYILNSENLD